MFVVFTEQSYAYKYCTKTALKERLLKRTNTQTNFYITCWFGLQTFLTKFNQVYENSYPQHGTSQLFLWKNVSTE